MQRLRQHDRQRLRPRLPRQRLCPSRARFTHACRGACEGGIHRGGSDAWGGSGGAGSVGAVGDGELWESEWEEWEEGAGWGAFDEDEECCG